jgi:CBS domain-containing protein
VTVERVRDAMVAAPRVLGASASAREAGDALARDEVRAVIVCDEAGRLVGMVTRKTLVREVVAPGRDPNAVTLGAIAETPYFTLDADTPLEEAFRFIEERDLERVPVIEEGRFVGVLSRSVVQRRLAEDEVDPHADPQDAQGGRAPS